MKGQMGRRMGEENASIFSPLHQRVIPRPCLTGERSFSPSLVQGCLVTLNLIYFGMTLVTALGGGQRTIENKDNSGETSSGW